MNEEFIFLIPNMTFYLSVGFLTGLAWEGAGVVGGVEVAGGLGKEPGCKLFWLGSAGLAGPGLWGVQVGDGGPRRTCVDYILNMF